MAGACDPHPRVRPRELAVQPGHWLVSSCRPHSFTIGTPPLLPTVARAYPARRRSSRTRYGVIRPTRIPADHYAIHDGCPVASPAWMVCDLARMSPRPAGLIVADAVMRAGTSRSDLLDVVDHMSHWPGVSAASWIAQHADGRAESGLETLGRLGWIEADLPISVVERLGRTRLSAVPARPPISLALGRHGR
jgi:hypothetical protein